MFDVWLGEIELTRLALLLSIAVVLPVQLVLCFRVKARVLRLLPAIILLLLTAGCLAMAAAASGWDGLGWLFLAIYAGLMLALCAVGWGIWFLVRRKSRK